MRNTVQHRKQRRTFRTDEVWKTIRQNIATYEWARQMATHHPYAELSDEKIYALMPACTSRRATSITSARRTVRITGFPTRCDVVGQRIRFHNQRHSAIYTIVSARPLAEGEWELELDLDSLIGAGQG